MNFRDKNQAINEIQIAAENEANYWSNSLFNQPLSQAMAQIIGFAVAAGIRRAIELQYSQDDFEKDLTLKP